MKPPPHPQPVTYGGFKEGHAWKRSELDKWTIAGGHAWAMIAGRLREEKPEQTEGEFYIMSDVSDAYEKSNAVVEDARRQYNKTVKEFRSEIKNDVSAISASSDKLQAELSRLASAFDHVSKLMNDGDMKVALDNAERLVTAFNALSHVNGHKLTFAVLSGKKESNDGI
jgi:hypothetical protein